VLCKGYVICRNADWEDASYFPSLRRVKFRLRRDLDHIKGFDWADWFAFSRTVYFRLGLEEMAERSMVWEPPRHEMKTKE
jgi:hypothetical protein